MLHQRSRTGLACCLSHACRTPSVHGDRICLPGQVQVCCHHTTGQCCWPPVRAFKCLFFSCGEIGVSVRLCVCVCVCMNAHIWACVHNVCVRACVHACMPVCVLTDMWEYMSDNFHSPVSKELFLLLLPRLNRCLKMGQSWCNLVYVLPVAQSACCTALEFWWRRFSCQGLNLWPANHESGTLLLSYIHSLAG